MKNYLTVNFHDRYDEETESQEVILERGTASEIEEYWVLRLGNNINIFIRPHRLRQIAALIEEKIPAVPVQDSPQQDAISDLSDVFNWIPPPPSGT